MENISTRRWVESDRGSREGALLHYTTISLINVHSILDLDQDPFLSPYRCTLLVSSSCVSEIQPQLNDYQFLFIHRISIISVSCKWPCSSCFWSNWGSPYYQRIKGECVSVWILSLILRSDFYNDAHKIIDKVPSFWLTGRYHFWVE